MKEKIIGGAVVLVLGGTSFAVSQTDIVNNFASETGMSQQQAQEYVDKVQENLASFGEIGKDSVTDGNSILALAADIDCVNYTYEWESSALSCYDGKSQIQTIGDGEVKLGECYQALDTDLGGGSNAKISECITDIDALATSYDQPIAAQIISSDQITEVRNTNAYNKSTLKAALESE